MRFLLVVSLLLTSASWARTYDLTHRFGIGTGLGYIYPLLDNEFDQFADDELTFNVHARYNSSKHDAIQFNFNQYAFERTDIGANVFDLMYIRRINEIDKFTPIFGLAAGVADMKNIEPFQDNLKFAGRFRFGFEYAWTPDLLASFTVDYQYIGKMPSNDEDEVEADRAFPGQEVHAVVPQASLTYFFGTRNEDDSSAPAAAQASGPDSDSDGVIDPHDKCPGTPAGVTVTPYGCGSGQSFTIPVDVSFASGSATLRSGAEQSLQELVSFLQQYPDTRAEIQGHTDNRGSSSANRDLSQRRAEAVKNHLVTNYQISPERVKAKGYGDTQPFADNNTAEGRTQNRRVLAVIFP